METYDDYDVKNEAQNAKIFPRALCAQCIYYSICYLARARAAFFANGALRARGLHLAKGALRARMNAFFAKGALRPARASAEMCRDLA